MHVLFLPAWYPSNANDIRGSFFREQALALHKSGCKVGVIAPSLLSVRKPLAALNFTRGISHENDNGVQTFRTYRFNFAPRVWPLIERRTTHATRALYEAYVAQEGHPDLIHVHSAWPVGSGAVSIKQRYGTPFILSEHSSTFLRGTISKFSLREVRKATSEATNRYAVSTRFSRTLEHVLELPDQSFAVMPNSVESSFLLGDVRGHNSEGFNFLHISGLNKNKNVSVLLNAFAERFKSQEHIKLTIGGRGPESPHLKALSENLGISSQVSFLGALARSKVRDCLAKSDAFVLPSRIETFGVVLVEALATGVPIVATRCGGPEDIVTTDNGILVPVDDIEALGNAMNTIYQNRSSYDPKKLRDDCRARFGSEAITQRWHSIYHEVLTPSAGPK